MANVLDEICAKKLEHIAERKATVPHDGLEGALNDVFVLLQAFIGERGGEANRCPSIHQTWTAEPFSS